MAIGDIDGNGIEDLIADFGQSGQGPGNSVTGIFARMNDSAWVKIANVSATAMTTCDIDNSGVDDIIVSSEYAGGRTWVRLDGTSDWKALANDAANLLACGSFDGDGVDQLVASFPFGTFKRNIDNEIPSWSQIFSSWALHLTTGNLNGDAGNQDDIVAAFPEVPGIWAIIDDGAHWTLQATTYTTPWTNPLKAMATGDVDGDGQDELIWSDQNTQYGNFSPWQHRLRISGAMAGALATGDIDGDGLKDDVVFTLWNSALERVYIYTSNSMVSAINLHLEPSQLLVGNISTLP